RRDAADEKEADAEHDPSDATGCEVKHRQEEPEVEQRGAEVSLKDEHRHREQPEDDEGSEIAPARKSDAEHLSTHHRECIGTAHEIAGEEHREQNLGNLAGLKR